jgi:fibronectin-binding autotransporter adhesin
LTLNGSRSVTISTTNNFTGPVVVNGGTLSVPTIANGGSPSALGAGTSLTLGGGAMLEYTGVGAATTNRGVLINVGGGAISVDSSSASLTLSGSMSGTDPLLKTGAGQLNLAGSGSAYNGTITVSQGTLGASTANSIGASASVVIGDANSGTTNPTFYFNGTGPVIGSLTVASNVTGAGLTVNPSGTFVKINGTMTLGSSLTFTQLGGSYFSALQNEGKITGNGGGAGNDTLVFNDVTSGGFQSYWQNDTTVANDFFGNVHFKSGDVRLQGTANNTAIPDASSLIIDSGARFLTNVANLTESFDGLSGGGSFGAFNNTTATFTIGVNNGSSTFSGGILKFDTATTNIVKSGTGTLVLTGTAIGGIPTATSSFSGYLTVDNGTLVVAATASGANTVLGNAVNTRTITINAGGTLKFIAPNATATSFSSTNVPTLNINGGTVTNAEPGAPFPAGKINNALNNVTLTNGLLTATTGQHGAYGAWNINGTITSSGVSTISTSDPVYGTVMLSSSAPAFTTGTTTVNVTDGTLTVSAPLIQDNDPGDNKVSALALTGPGTLVLTASNNYMGGTSVYDGTLIATNVNAIASGTNLSIGDPTLLTMLPAAVVPMSAPTAAPAITPVPEPGTLALLATVFGGAIVYRRIRKK